MNTRLRSQRGTTLVELVIVMAITSMVVLVLAGVTFAVTQLSNTWGTRLSDAQQGELLPEAVSADAGKYALCSGDGFDLDFCTPDAAATKVVHYRTPAACPCDVTRTLSWLDGNGVQQTGGARVVARALVQRPVFKPECAAGASGAGNTGYLVVTGVQFAGDRNAQPQQTIFFRSPSGACSA